MEWSTACLDWERRILAREPLIPFAPLFPDEAAASRQVLSELRIADVPGSPTMGEISREWVFQFCDAIFGAYNHETGRRLVQEFFLLISKKNTKSTTAAAIMMTALIRNWREDGEFYILAPTKEVADNSFKPAASMVAKDDELGDLLHVQPHQRIITHRGTGATLKVVAADSGTVSGKKTIGLLVDELWLFGKRADAEDMLREATGGLASRPEGFTIYLTTQSDEPPAGVFRKKLMYARGVRDGRIKDNRFLPVLYEFPDAILKANGHKDRANFYVTNPNMGASVDEEFLTREHAKAIEDGEDSVRGFLAKHLNVEIGLALRSDRWVGADHWEAAVVPAISLDYILDRCDVVVAGVDGGGLDDLEGLAVLGRERGTRRWLLWCKAWAHRGVLDIRKEIAPRLKDFEAAGELTFVDDMEQAFAEVADILAIVDQAGLLAFVGLDPMGVGAQVDALAQVGIGGEQDQSPKQRVVGISQGWTLNGAIKTAEIKLAAKTLLHAGQALMAWCVGNAKTEPKGNAVTITKAVAGRTKIDPLMAAFNAVALMSKNPEPPQVRSIYEDTEARPEGLLIL